MHHTGRPKQVQNMFFSWICKSRLMVSWKQHKAPPVPLLPWNQNKLCQTVHSANTTQSYPTKIVSLCSIAASDFPYALLFDIASSKKLLTFNSLSKLVLQAANASFLCIAVRADVLLEVEKYLPSSSSDSAVKLSQNFCRYSTNGDEVAHAFSATKKAFRHTPPNVFEETVAPITCKRHFHAHSKSRNQFPRKTSLASWPALQVELISPRKRQ